MSKSASPYLLGPFSQLLTMSNLPKGGPIKDDQLIVLTQGAIAIENGFIKEVGAFESLKKSYHCQDPLQGPLVALPAFIDSHTHLCFAGLRAKDYALRVSGISYQEIARQGGGILDTVRATREASEQQLNSLMQKRLTRLISEGVATCEVKSGYGLSVLEELKMLRVINALAKSQPLQLVPTCLAAHCRPLEFDSNLKYLSYIVQELLPQVKTFKLAKRVDIFVEKGAFSVAEARKYLLEAKNMGFAICLHADQFSRGGACLAAEMQALSADHLEASEQKDFEALKAKGVIPIVLPGACLGLGMPFAKARHMLDIGLPLVIASDFNPGSAPMGNLLAQAALLGASERLSLAETLAAITTRAAFALNVEDRGVLKPGMRADISAFACASWQEILYHQGSLLPKKVWIGGVDVLK